MPSPKLTPEEYAEMMKVNKPHLIALEEIAQEVEYGKVEVTLEIRAGVVNKMEFHSTKTWLSPKTHKT